MSRILLTGATGFIGQYLIDALLAERHTILAPTRDATILRENYFTSKLFPLEGEFYADPVLEKYRSFHPEIIIHLAAKTGHQHGRWKDYYRVNVWGTERLIDFALQNDCKLFIYCSTVGVYGTVPARLPADPWTAAEPEGNYFRSKFLAEKSVVVRLRERMPFIIMRPSLVYGPGSDGFLYKLVQMVKKHRFPLIKDDVLIHLVDIDTVVNFIINALKVPVKGEHIVNIADKKPVALQKLVDLVHAYFYNTPYPRLLKVSPLWPALLANLAKYLQAPRLYRKIRLISNSWYYDTTNLEEGFPLQQADTMTAVENYLRRSFPRKKIS